jgi:hypothetical protein
MQSPPITRRLFLAGAAAVAVMPAADSKRSLIILSESDAARMRDGLTTERRALIETEAAAALKAGPWSVTYHRPVGIVEAGPNDYVSEGPYWWPDPKDPKAPYIRKDGQRNPARFLGNRNDLGNMCSAILSLGMGAFFLKNPACSARANQVLPVWFIDPKTRMSPNLEHGQLTRGHDTGRGTGMIDTVSLIHLAQGVTLLELAGGLDASVATGVREWYAAYLHWATTSAKGLSEKKSGNNHATWWTAQMAAYAAFTGDADARKMAWDHFRTYLVPTEIQPNGSCPREEARTASLSYSSMNLDAFSTICRIAQLDGVDLWHFKTGKGIGVVNAFEYLIPYLLDPKKWTREQINPYNPGGYYFPALAGMGLPSEKLMSAYLTLPRSQANFVQLVDMLVRK